MRKSASGSTESLSIPDPNTVNPPLVSDMTLLFEQCWGLLGQNQLAHRAHQAAWVVTKGRMKFCRPTFRGLFDQNPELAKKTFSENAEFYVSVLLYLSRHSTTSSFNPCGASNLSAHYAAPHSAEDDRQRSGSIR